MVVETLQECWWAKNIYLRLFKSLHTYLEENPHNKNPVHNRLNPTTLRMNDIMKTWKESTYTMYHRGFGMVILREEYKLGMFYNLEQGGTRSEQETS
jgi:hypothetical protein